MDTDTETLTVSVTADTTSLRRELDSAARYGRQFSSALVSAFDGLIFKGRSFSDVLKGLAERLSQMALKAAFKPLESAFGNLFSGIFSGGFAFARGGVVQQGLPIPFAKGGVVSQPTFFPLAGGRTGLMGERGAEAILPLARGPGGRLGVDASGAGRPITVTFNVTTPDAESFRRSEGQIAALVSRAVSRGNRHL